MKGDLDDLMQRSQHGDLAMRMMEVTTANMVGPANCTREHTVTGGWNHSCWQLGFLLGLHLEITVVGIATEN